MFTFLFSSRLWDISTALYASKNVDTSSEDPTYLYGIFFKPDGLSLYTISRTIPASTYQYNLTSAWDLDTASYASKSADLSSEDTVPGGVFFKPDGKTMYITGNANDSVFQYTVSTAWDVSTASYASKSKDISAETTTPSDLFFHPSGDKMYVMSSGGDDTVYQYTLLTPWDVSTASYASKSLDISSEATTNITNGLFIGMDGARLYFTEGGGVNKIFQYTLSTPWDLSTGSYYSKNFDSSSQITTLYGIFISPDGSYLYLGDLGNLDVEQYLLR